MGRINDMLRFYRTGVRQLASWLQKDAEDWRRRLALTYAVSIWSMFSLVAFTHWWTKDASKVPETDKETIWDLEEDRSLERKSGFKLSTSIEYKDNFIPYTARFFQHFTPSNKTSAGGSTEN